MVWHNHRVDFARELDDIGAFLSSAGFPFAVIGGVAQDMADIGYLLTLEGVKRDEVRGYFEKADLLERWRELERAL